MRIKEVQLAIVVLFLYTTDMNKEEFEKVINQLQALSVDRDNLNNAFRKFDPDFNFVTFSRYESIITNMLKTLFGDKDDWIGYFIYELDYGKKYKKGMVTDKGKDIKLKSAGNLFDFLVDINFNK